MAWQEPLICDTVLKKNIYTDSTLQSVHTEPIRDFKSTDLLGPQILAAWNVPSGGHAGVSKCSLLDCNFLLDPSPPRPLPVFSFAFHNAVPMFSPDILPCAKSTRNLQIWCYTFAVIIEMRTSLDCFFFLNFDQHSAAKLKKEKWCCFIVFAYKNKIIDPCSLPPWEMMKEDRHHWTRVNSVRSSVPRVGCTASLPPC